MELGRYLVGMQLRRRWVTVALLALLVAVVSASVLTATAGARRTRTAFDRYLAAYDGIDMMVGTQGGPLSAAEVAAIDGVHDAIAFTWYATFPSPEAGFFPLLVPADGSIPATYQRAPLMAGRLPDPAAPHEVALGERAARRLGVGVGDALPILTFSPEAVEQMTESESTEFQPDGELDLSVVGIVRTPGDVGGRPDDIELTPLTPAFADEHGDDFGVFDAGVLVVLEPGASIDAVSASIGELGDYTIDSTNSARSLRNQIDPTLGSMASALYLVALAALVAGAVAIGLGASRAAQDAAGDDAVLRAVGVDGPWLLARLAAPAALAVLIGVVVGAGASVLLSPVLPVGLARRAEPHPGFAVDTTVLGVGSLVLAVVALAVVALAALLVLRRERHRIAVSSPSRLAGAAAAGGLPAPVVTGLHFALDTGRGPRATPVRTAALATAAAVTGVVAAAIVALSIQHAITTPAVYGAGWDLLLKGTGDDHVPAGLVDEAALAGDASFSAVAEVTDDLEVVVDDIAASAVVVDDLRGHTPFVIVRGREPRGSDEVGLGAETLADLGLGLGDTVTVDAGQPREMTLVGIVAMPVSVDGGSNRQGVALTRAAADAAGFTDDCGGEEECSRNYALVGAPGIDLTEAVGPYLVDGGVDTEAPVAPGDVDRLSAVAATPSFLAGLLGAIGLVAIGYVAVSTVRRRRRDLALLRVLGFTGAQLRSLLAVQLTTLAALGAVCGVLLGALVGAAVWTSLADQVGIPVVIDRPASVLIGVPLVAALLGLALSVPSGRRAAAVSPALVLRQEASSWR